MFTKITGENTKILIQRALKNINGITIPKLVSDAGAENINSSVRELVVKGRIDQSIAQVDIHSSNSMVEAFFRSFKNNYLLFSKINYCSKSL